jgi:hypothetical protein
MTVPDFRKAGSRFFHEEPSALEEIFPVSVIRNGRRKLFGTGLACLTENLG